MSQSTSQAEGAHSPLEEVAEQLSHLWWIPLLTGLISIGLAYAYSDDSRRLITSQFIRARSLGEGLIRRAKPAQSA